MIHILNIETATTVCSVSVSRDGELLHYKETDNGFTHAENLHLFIAELLKECSLEPNQLSAVAVSRGPGSYTGLRIGVSTAKGLAFALNIPLIAVDTLQVMANQALSLSKENALYCPMIDARRMEVYTCLYDGGLITKQEVEALIVDENSIQKFKSATNTYFFGDGMDKCREILQTLPNARFMDHIRPSSQFMCSLTYRSFLGKKFEDVAYFEPFYLKDFLILQKKT